MNKGIILAEEIPTIQEKDSADAMFGAMVEAKFDVHAMSRILKHLGSVLILYAEQADLMAKESKAEIDKAMRAN
tara:strand:+ start:255 stop:476 length:222 start_codon:yes stop_codon:yes gene_type:complete